MSSQVINIIHSKQLILDLIDSKIVMMIINKDLNKYHLIESKSNSLLDIIVI